MSVSKATGLDIKPLVMEQMARRYVNEVLNQQRFDLMVSMLASTVVATSPLGISLGREEVMHSTRLSVLAFRDYQMEIQHSAVGEDCVFLRTTVHATQVRDFAGISATRRRLSLPVIYLFEFENGLITKIESHYDTQALLSQLSSDTRSHWR